MASGDKQDPFSAATAQLTFHNFLEKMRHPSAVDLVRAIKGFIVSFQASAPDPDKDSAAVQQFLAQTEATFRAHPLWAGATEEELESAGEGLEKYLLTKVFARAFGPIPADAATDRLLAERMAALQQFLRPEHLDIPASFGNEPSWLLAQKELGKLGAYKAPRDKLVCILNCCRVINNLLLNMAMAAQGDPPGADDFLPVLIYVVIKANPPALHSNLQFIQRYRAASRLVAESAYFFTNAVSAAAFIEHLNPSSLSIDPAEFESKMQQALAQIPPNISDGTPPQARKASTPPGKAGDLPPRHNRSHSEGDTSPRIATQPGMSNSGSSPMLVTADAAAGGLAARAPAPPPSPGLTVSPADSASAPLTQPGDSLAQLEARGAAAVVSAAESGQLARDYRFLYTSVGDLRVGDVDALLTEYKELVLKYEALARGLQERNAGLARQLGVTAAESGGPGQSESESGAGKGDSLKTAATGNGPAGGFNEGKALEAVDGMPGGNGTGADESSGDKEATLAQEGTGLARGEVQGEASAPQEAGSHAGGAGQAGSQPEAGVAKSGEEKSESETAEQHNHRSEVHRGQGHDMDREEKSEAQGSRADSEPFAEAGDGEASRRAEIESDRQARRKAEGQESGGGQPSDDMGEHAPEAARSTGVSAGLVTSSDESLAAVKGVDEQS